MKKLLIVLLLLFSSCSICKRQEYYNIIYNQAGNIIEYYDVTDLHSYNNYVYFTTCDGALVMLSGGAIEIIKLDVD